MKYPEIDFSAFKGRTKKLEEVIRYHAYVPMFYRSNLVTHTTRMLWMLESLIPTVQEYFPDFNVALARTMALVHDDHEMDPVLGDVQFGHKLLMTPEEKRQLKIAEEAARRKVASWFPETVNGFSYLALMEAYEHQDGTQIEPTIIKLLDKFDAFGEALHELYAGNRIFATAAKGMAMDPPRTFVIVLTNFARDYPILAPLFANASHPLFVVPSVINPENISGAGTVHTPENIIQEKGYLHYDLWRSIVLSRGGIDMLVQKKE